MMALLDYTSVNTILLCATVLIGLLIAGILLHGQGKCERRQVHQGGSKSLAGEGVKFQNNSEGEGEVVGSTVTPAGGGKGQVTGSRESSIGEDTSGDYSNPQTTQISKECDQGTDNNALATSETVAPDGLTRDDQISDTEDENGAGPVLVTEASQDDIETSLKAAGNLGEHESEIKEGWIVL